MKTSTDDERTTSLRSRLDRAFIVVLVLLLGAGATGVAAAATVDRVMEVLLQRDVPLIAANAAVLQALTDAETGERGFLLTGDETSLVPFERGRSDGTHPSVPGAPGATGDQLPGVSGRSSSVRSGWGGLDVAHPASHPLWRLGCRTRRHRRWRCST